MACVSQSIAAAKCSGSVSLVLTISAKTDCVSKSRCNTDALGQRWKPPSFGLVGIVPGTKIDRIIQKTLVVNRPGFRGGCSRFFVRLRARHNHRHFVKLSRLPGEIQPQIFIAQLRHANGWRRYYVVQTRWRVCPQGLAVGKQEIECAWGAMRAANSLSVSVNSGTEGTHLIVL